LKKFTLIIILFVSTIAVYPQGAIEAAVRGELMQAAFLGLIILLGLILIITFVVRKRKKEKGER
jgi:ABC-type Fe3+ transport system permease subunit